MKVKLKAYIGLDETERFEGRNSRGQRFRVDSMHLESESKVAWLFGPWLNKDGSLSGRKNVRACETVPVSELPKEIQAKLREAGVLKADGSNEAAKQAALG